MRSFIVRPLSVKSALFSYPSQIPLRSLLSYTVKSVPSTVYLLSVTYASLSSSAPDCIDSPRSDSTLSALAAAAVAAIFKLVLMFAF